MRKTSISFILIVIMFMTLMTSHLSAAPNFDAKALYDAKDMVNRINQSMQEYAKANPDFVQTFKIGASLLGKDILAVKVGTGKKEVFINGAHHGREMMTSVLMMNQVDDLINRYKADEQIKNLLNEVSIIFVPMVNPDGIDISKGAAQPTVNVVTPISTGSRKYIGWKANARGVDPNRNYPMRWDYIKQDPGKPAYSHYKGIAPFSEPENQAIQGLVQSHDFELVIAYHSAGEVIFWYAYQEAEALKRDLTIAQEIGKMTGYQIDQTRETAGGMKDWFAYEYKKPGFTIEIGQAKYGGHRYDILPFSEYARAWQKNKEIPLYLAGLVSIQLNPKKPDFYDIRDNQELLNKVESYGITGIEDNYGNVVFAPNAPADMEYATAIAKTAMNIEELSLYGEEGKLSLEGLYDVLIATLRQKGIENTSKEKLAEILAQDEMDLTEVSREEFIHVLERLKEIKDF